MTRIGWLLLSAVALAVGCQQPTDDHARHDEHAHDAAPAPTAGHLPTNVLRISPDMLRDVRVTTVPVEVRASSDGVTALGELRVNEAAYAEVGVSIPARATRLLASQGDTVQPGQPLAEFESVELGRARAEYLQARARVALTAQAVARKRALAAERILPRRELQEAEAEATAAQAALAAARVGLQALGVSDDERDDGGGDMGGRLVLRAPIGGIVLDRAVARGQMVDPSRPLFRLADLTHLWLVVHAYERDAVRVRGGASARVTFPAFPGRTFAGTIALVGSEVERDSRTIPVRIDMANVDGNLRPGMSATAWLPLGDAGAAVLTVPVAALQRTHDGWSVFVPRADGTFEIRPVGRGRDLGGEVEIVTGLRGGETVVADGAFLLKAEADKARGDGEQHAH